MKHFTITTKDGTLHPQRAASLPNAVVAFCRKHPELISVNRVQEVKPTLKHAPFNPLSASL